MSNCDLNFGRSIQCYNNVGGIRAVYIVPFAELPFSEIFINEDELINIGGLTPNAYKYEIQSSTDSFDESNNVDDNGNSSWQGSLNITLAKQDNLSQAELKRLPNGRDKVIVEYNNNYFRLMGVENGCDFKVNTASGGGLGDFNGYNVEITSQEGIMSPFIYVTLEDLGITVVDDDPQTTPDGFVTRWRTTMNGESITLPYDVAGTYSGTINWGDGTTSDNTYANRTHVYSTAGDYIITIDGVINDFAFNNNNSKSNSRVKIREIIRWGPVQLGEGAFYGCSNLTANLVEDILINVPTQLINTFRDCTSLKNIRFIGSWNMSAVTILQATFRGCSMFNESIDRWDTSSVVSLFEMFRDCTLYNQPMNSWDTSNVNSFQRVFNNATSFNQDLNSWNVGVGNNFDGIFQGATSFNGNITSWSFETINNVVANNMFNGATSFNQDIGGWNSEKFGFMTSMFQNATSFNQNISNWDFTNLITISGLNNFMTGKDETNYDCVYYSNLLQNWGDATTGILASMVVGMGGIQYDTTAQADRDYLTTTRNWSITDGGVCDTSDSFQLQYELISVNDLTIELPYIPVGTYTGTIYWGDGTSEANTYQNRFHTYDSTGTYTVQVVGDIEEVSFKSKQGVLFLTEIQNWGPNTQLGIFGSYFVGCVNLDITATDTPIVTSMNRMFNRMAGLVNANGSIGTWDVLGVTDFRFCFAGTTFNQDISDWDMSSATNLESMFHLNTSFNQPLSAWTTTNVTNMSNMFNNATAFNQNIDNWDTSSVTSMRRMFQSADAFNQPVDGWDFNSITDLSYFMNFKTAADYSTTNYDNLLIKWAASTPNNLLEIYMGSIQRTPASAGQFGQLIFNKGWQIFDGGVFI